ncbi:hypothetical protein JCM5350_008188 [Sporobolomyces pararoseus]
MERIVVKKNGIEKYHDLVRRQGLGDSLTSALGGGNGNGNNGNGNGNGGAQTTTTTAASTSTTTSEDSTTTTTTTPPADSSSSAAESSRSSSSEAEASSSSAAASSSSAAESSSSSRDRTTSSAAPSETTVTSVITPTTIIVIGTSSITSTLPPVTSASTRAVSGNNSGSSASGGSQLSTGAKAGIAVGAAVGALAVLALLAFVCLGVRRRKRDKQNAADNILWPAVGDSSTLYPEQVHNTGGAGFGVGDDDDLDGPSPGGGHGGEMSETGAMYGAGAAGVGAAAAAASRYGRQPTLPQVPPSVYSSEQTGYPYSSEGGGGGNYLAPSVPETGYAPSSSNGAYTSNGYSAPGSQHSHAPLMAGAGAGGLAAGGLAYNHSQSTTRHTPSPPQDYSQAGHSTEESGQLPFPGEPEPDFATMGAGARPVSPTPMQVGDTFGQGYDETDNGKRWRLSVVNDDPRDRD